MATSVRYFGAIAESRPSGFGRIRPHGQELLDDCLGWFSASPLASGNALKRTLNSLPHSAHSGYQFCY